MVPFFSGHVDFWMCNFFGGPNREAVTFQRPCNISKRWRPKFVSRWLLKEWDKTKGCPAGSDRNYQLVSWVYLKSIYGT